MLQVNTAPYASDALEDAMRLAQTKAINSYSFSDCLNYLNYTWMDMYQRIISIDSGFYSQTIRLTSRLTKLPAFFKNSITVYAAQRPMEGSRQIFRASGMNDLEGWDTYNISGFDLFCPAATQRTVWLEYVPMQPQLFFTAHNRDPKIIHWLEYEHPADGQVILKSNYNLYVLTGSNETEDGTWVFYLRSKRDGTEVDVTDTILQHGEDWVPYRIICDFPYVFVTYKHAITDEYWSGFYRDILTSSEWIEYNPFAFTGRNSQVEYIDAKWNDKTGMGVTVYDWNDMHIVEGVEHPRIKELGWTPDSLLVYPCPEMYRYLVARLADKFSALNESQPMGVAKELVEAQYAFEAFCGKDKSSFTRIRNVNGPYLTDWIV